MTSPRTIPRICAQCGEEFLAVKHQVERGVAVYCSKKCRNLSNRKPAMDRFLKKVNKTADCWVWVGAKRHALGYGGFYYNGKWTHAHRAAYEMFIGPIPSGYHVAHSCDNPSCVNPDHLWIGTHQDNMRDMHEKGRDGGGFVKKFLGEEHGQSKLTDSDVREIREKYARGGISYRELGEQYGMKCAQIGAIVRREAWVHID